ncbi:hypothetical protein FRC07_010125 [Ceratobasidium sp. 392]|nr:hypothetical protein FRC07_010125 [Ceratobasidium sp. 392]
MSKSRPHSWRQSVNTHFTNHPNPSPSPSPAPTSTYLHASSNPSTGKEVPCKHKAVVVAKRQKAQKELEAMIVPPRPRADAQRDMMANVHSRLEHLAKSTIGRKERRKAPKRALAGFGDDEEDETDEHEDEVEQGNEAGEDTAHAERNLTQSKPKHKPRTNDLKGYERRVIIYAKLLLWAYAVAYDAYLEREVYLVWAVLVYKIAWYYVFPKIPYRAPKEIAYPIDPRRHKGHYHSEIVPRSLAGSLFYGENSIGVLFHDLLNPIPVPTLAFILTNIEWCLTEWDGWSDTKLKGVYAGRRFNQVTLKYMRKRYLGQLENIRRYRTKGDDILAELREQWFRYAIVYSGATIHQDEDDLPGLIDINEFFPPDESPSLGGSPPPAPPRRKRQRSPAADHNSEAGLSKERPHRKRSRKSTVNRNSEAGPSKPRPPGDEPESDHDVAMSLERALYEADAELFNGEPMDIDVQLEVAAQSEREPTPEIYPDGTAKGKGRS